MTVVTNIVNGQKGVIEMKFRFVKESEYGWYEDVYQEFLKLMLFFEVVIHCLAVYGFYVLLIK